MKIAVVHGPNLNFCGIREPEIYGFAAFSEICERIERFAAAEAGGKIAQIVQFQSNSEGEIIDFIQHCHHEGFFGIVINPGALAHYSYALYDALAAVKPITIEVHMSNIAAREEFRQKSVTAAACIGQISGFGVESYTLAISHLIYLGSVGSSFANRLKR
jgi:3-dehydroquinate dehydratase-2